MSYKDLLVVLGHKFKMTPDELQSSKLNQHKHALNLVYRGQKVISNIKALAAEIDISGRRVLDVGCGYGGVLREFAREGATCVGIDLSDNNLMIAKEYFKGEATVELFNVRADDSSIVNQLGSGVFDIITATSVMEHIYDIDRFVNNIHELLRPGGVFYYTIPNHMSLHAITKEPHVSKPLLSIVPPDLWVRYGAGSPGTYHRSIDVYESLFLACGFAQHIKVPLPKNIDFGKEIDELPHRFDALFASVEVVDSHIEDSISVYKNNLQYDLSRLDQQALYYKYLHYDHSGVFLKKKHSDESRTDFDFDVGGLLDKYPSAHEIWLKSRTLLDAGKVNESKRMERLNMLLHNSVIPAEADLFGVEFAYGGVGVVVNKNCKVGKGSRIGSNVTLGGGAFKENRADGRKVYAPIIGENVYIATGAKILGGVRVGFNSVVGANAVVNSDVNPCSVVAGVPAKVICTINKENYNRYATFFSYRKYDEIFCEKVSSLGAP